MAPPELWLLRHGATEWALSGRHTGSTDLPLLAEGEAEARALAPLLSRQQFAAVYTSPLQRARQTCALAGLGGQAVIEPDLREWDYGRYEGITTAEIRQTVPGWSVFTHPCPDGERLEEVQQRCEGLISRLVERHPGEKVALFAHGHILRSLAGCWLGLGVAGGALLVLGTGSFCVLGSEREQRTLLRWNAPVQLP